MHPLDKCGWRGTCWTMLNGQPFDEKWRGVSGLWPVVTASIHARHMGQHIGGNIPPDNTTTGFFEAPSAISVTQWLTRINLHCMRTPSFTPCGQLIRGGNFFCMGVLIMMQWLMGQ
ncbi:hypothetical protein E4U43_004917 [Claviceps pusilla]|uniref:Uncharacterized protein n=1 Tax=Claviceps pusilla TaxID=123648 RepID=A0A9P7SVT4_9HYPO|nr:hypothetical protein E4U43_004917 [Claviceps pusilla]